NVVVIVAPCIAGNPPARFAILGSRGRIGGARLRAVVVEQTDDGASNSRQGSLGIGPPWISKIHHLSRVSSGKPLRSLFELWEFFRAHDSAKVETERFRPVNDPNRIGKLHHQ